MKFLTDDLDFQAMISLNGIAFHNARFTILDSLTNTTTYKFDDSTKAIICTVLEQILDWSNEVYMALRNSKVATVDTYIIKTLSEKFLDGMSKSVHVTRMKYPDIDVKLALILMVISDKYKDHLVFRINKLLDNNTTAAVTDLNNFLIQYMNHLRIVMHEMDCLIFGSKKSCDPFLTIDLLDLAIYRDRSISMPVMRLSVYRESRYIQGRKLCIKSYIDSVSLESDPKLHAEYESLLDSLKQEGMEIVCIL